jgi:hypothetical protein
LLLPHELINKHIQIFSSDFVLFNSHIQDHLVLCIIVFRNAANTVFFKNNFRINCHHQCGLFNETFRQFQLNREIST